MQRGRVGALHAASEPTKMNTTMNMENETQTQIQSCPEEVAQRAYQIWQAAGRPTGRDLEHWLQAEAELRAGGPVYPPQVKAPELGLQPRLAEPLGPAKHKAQTRRFGQGKSSSRLG